MPIDKPSDIILHGQFYTPSKIADYLIKNLIFKDNINIFDPAYGEGALLLAAERRCRLNNLKYDVYGCDKYPNNKLINHFNTSNFSRKDFFDYSSDKLFDLILMNPPFVRYQNQNKERTKQIREKNILFKELDVNSDLWCYFILKSLMHLNHNGEIAAILPWSMIQAEYAVRLREILFEKFENIRILVSNKSYFEGTNIKVLFLWLSGYGLKNKNIELGYTSDLDSKVEYESIKKDNWEAQYILDKNNNMIIDNCLTEYSFTRFGNHGKVKIGVVTGANEYFILGLDSLKKLNLPKKLYLPIIKSSFEFSGLHFNGYKPNNYLLLINESNKYISYIRKGVRNKFNKRIHSVNREPWYRVKTGEAPDAFFPYRSSMIPYLAFNDSLLQSTNSIHRIYFNIALSKTQLEWIQLSLLSVYGQISIENTSKIYGSGVLKVEPSSLMNSVVTIQDNPIDSAYRRIISELLSNGFRYEAMKLASEIINKQNNIPNNFYEKSLNVFCELVNRRRGKKFCNST